MFTSVSIGFEDPGVAARKKVVVITVTEKRNHYLDIKGGFATGDGFRIGFEYGHRNLGGRAIAMTLRSQLGLRPPGLILRMMSVKSIFSSNWRSCSNAGTQ